MTDLLARFAESAFWLGRYMERADISHEILTVEPGAYFEGQVQPLKQAISARATTKSA